MAELGGGGAEIMTPASGRVCVCVCVCVLYGERERERERERSKTVILKDSGGRT